MANIQISEELFTMMCRYVMFDQIELKTDIIRGIEDKFDAMAKREIYTKYKTAATDEQKEKFRQEYLEKAGISKDFRY